MLESAEGARFELEQNPKHKMSFQGNFFLQRQRRSRPQSMKAIWNTTALVRVFITVGRAEQVC